jgi:glycyl-tRNA synthetase
MPKPTGTAMMEKLVALCRRRGFIFQSSEIYGGINGFWDYGPLGVLLKNNIRDRWWKDMVLDPPPGPSGEPLTILPLDCSIISHPRVWEASGHVSSFADPMQTCRQCKRLFRADQVAEQLAESAWVKALVESGQPAGKWLDHKGRKLAPEGVEQTLKPRARKRVVIKVTPERISSWDHSKLGGTY